MRELFKSVFGFSLAMSLLGMEQIRNTLRKKENNDERREDWIKADLESVTNAAGERLGERTHKVFDAGDRFQRETVDLVFDIFKSDDAKPKRSRRRNEGPGEQKEAEPGANPKASV